MDKCYIAIDLKSFYASVECVERGFDPMTTNLVVADESRTEKTICLAVTPALKSLGIPGRPRLFEVVAQVAEINARRRLRAPGGKFTGKSYDLTELEKNPSLELTYVVAPPRMAYYMNYSTGIYNIYLDFIAPEDIHVYSIDEVFMDVTGYLNTYRTTPRELAMQIVRRVMEFTGITATVGIGTNLYLAKVAMDIVAKHIPADADGVRIAQLDEMEYRRQLWCHRPLTDFWRVGPGYTKKLEKYGLYTMGDIARCSLGKATDFHNEDLLYKLFGVNAELLIDHAWGWEPATIPDIKAYRPESNSLSVGQVLTCPYTVDKARVVLGEMVDALVLDLVDKGLVTDQMVLTVGYDRESLTDGAYRGPVVSDHYGRLIPKHAHGTANLGVYSCSARRITQAVLELFDRIVDKTLLVRRLTVAACRVVAESQGAQQYQQTSFFEEPPPGDSEKERRLQETVLELKKKFGKNAVLKGASYTEGATAITRNGQIGGHKA